MFRNLRYILLPVFNITAPVCIAFALIMLIPAFLSVILGDRTSMAFLSGAALSLVAGLLLKLLSLRDQRELLPRDGFLLASLIWVLIPLFASVPLYLAIPNISYTHAFFEAMSGTTTTCATVLSGLDFLAPTLNFWRCFLSWLGGMGILVLAVAILPLLGVGGAQVFKAETSGPMKEMRLTPRIADTAKGLWGIYLTMSFVCALAFHFAGMDTFDSITHMFSTVSLGGFSTHDSSFGYFNNPLIEAIAVFFFLVSGTSFSLHFIAWSKRSIRHYLKNIEFLAWIGIALAVTLAVASIPVFNNVYNDWPTALRYAAFNVISTISTAGFATADFGAWPIAAPTLMLICACFATCGGSTGGGVKMMRTIILTKAMTREFTRTLNPTAILPLKVAKNVIPARVTFTVMSFMVLWAIVLTSSALIFMLTGLDPITAFSTAIACLSNIGPGLGQVGPAGNFSNLSDFQLWLCSFCMLVGRLELITVFTLFTRSFWRL